MSQLETLQIYEKQWATAQEILKHFEAGHRWTILCAQPQAGKTGTCRATCRLMLEKGLIEPGRIYLICGMNYNNLKNQEIREFWGLIPRQNVLFSKDLEKLERQAFGLGKKSKTTTPTRKYDFSRSLFILDESHFAQNALPLTSTLTSTPTDELEEDSLDDDTGSKKRPSLVTRFFLRQVGLTLDGQTEKWHPSHQQSYFLSVSATPMSEIAHLTKQVKISKQQVLLQIDNDYYGFEKMILNNKLFQSKDLNKKSELISLVDIFVDHYRRQQLTKQFKYAFLRVNNTERGQLIQNAFRLLLKSKIDDPQSYRIMKLHSQEQNIKDINIFLDQPPDRFTIYFVYHSLRAGIQVNTEHVCLVHENPQASPDTSAQALPGRCCGYGKEAHGVEVYCHRVAILDYLQLVKRAFDPHFVPSGCRNIKQALIPKSGSSQQFRPNPVVAVQLPKKLLEAMLVFRQEHPKFYEPFWGKFSGELLTLFDPQVSGWFSGINEHKAEVNGNEAKGKSFWEEYEYWGMMIFTAKNSRTSWHDWWESNYQAFLQGKRKCSFNTQQLPSDRNNFYFVYLNFNPSHLQYGFALLTSKSRLLLDLLPSSGQVLTSGLEQFHPDQNPDLSRCSLDELVKLPLIPPQVAYLLPKKRVLKKKRPLKKRNPKQISLRFYLKKSEPIKKISLKKN